MARADEAERQAIRGTRRCADVGPGPSGSYASAMPGRRGIGPEDLIAQLRQFGPPGADASPLERLDAGTRVRSLSELELLCPPRSMGLRPGSYVALFAPLFGEFE